MPNIDVFVDQLKRRLKAHKENYVEHESWCGCTEGGFYDTDTFDFDKLMEEIDLFTAEFKAAQ